MNPIMDFSKFKLKIEKSKEGIEFLNELGNGIGDVDDLYLLCKNLDIHNEPEEIFGMICFDAKLNPTGYFECSRGELTGTIVVPREIAKRAIIANAHSVAFVHNHPSGNVTPSERDNFITVRLVKIMNFLGINVIDHLIIGDGDFYSYKRSGSHNIDFRIDYEKENLPEFLIAAEEENKW